MFNVISPYTALISSMTVLLGVWLRLRYRQKRLETKLKAAADLVVLASGVMPIDAADLIRALDEAGFMHRRESRRRQTSPDDGAG